MSGRSHSRTARIPRSGLPPLVAAALALHSPKLAQAASETAVTERRASGPGATQEPTERGETAPASPVTAADEAGEPQPDESGGSQRVNGQNPSPEADGDTSAERQTYRPASELPESPLSDADLVALPERSSRFRSFLGEPRFHALVSASTQFVFRRPSQDGVTVAPRASWGLAATILLTDWLGVRLNANLESHRVRAEGEYFGLDGSAMRTPNLFGIRMGLELEPRYPVLDGLWLWFGAGIAWARFSQDSLSSSGAVPLTVPPRSGVLVEVPARAGVTVVVIPNWLGVTVGGRFAYPTSQSGDLFASADRGSQQVVREDSGMVVYVRGLPSFKPAWSVELALDLFL